MRWKLAAALAGAVTVLVAAPAAAAPAASAPAGSPPYPAPAVCVDTAHELGVSECTRITRVLTADEQAGPEKDEIAVAVVPTTGSASIETWSTGLFNAWGVGQAGTDNGVLLVVAVADRALRIVTGDGLRTRLSDGRASEIIGSTITPLLRRGRTVAAVQAGLDAIRTELGHDISGSALAAPGTTAGLDADPYVSTLSDDADDSGSGSQAGLWVLLLIGLVVVGVVVSMASKTGYADGDGSDDGYSSTRRRSYSSPRRSFSSSSSRRSSSSSSRRSGGFGGGRSSGGGSSGRW